MSALNSEWHKPTRSGPNGQCVQARYINGAVEVRNSNSPQAGTVAFTPQEWQTFIEAVTVDGEFRLV